MIVVVVVVVVVVASFLLSGLLLTGAVRWRRTRRDELLAKTPETSDRREGKAGAPFVPAAAGSESHGDCSRRPSVSSVQARH